MKPFLQARTAVRQVAPLADASGQVPSAAQSVSQYSREQAASVEDATAPTLQSTGSAKPTDKVAAKSSVETEQAGRLLDEMVPGIKKTSDLMREIAATSRERSTSATAKRAVAGHSESC